MANTTAAVIAGLAVGIGFILIVDVALDSLPPTHIQKSCYNPLVFLIPFSLPQWVGFSEQIVIGKVVSLKYRIVDESFTSIDPNTGESVFSELKNSYVFVTIQVEKYLKDSSSSYLERITFRDMGMAGCYTIGEESIFFIADVNGNPQLFAYASKFDINEEKGTVQSKYLENQGEPPRNLTNFEKAIKDEIAKH